MQLNSRLNNQLKKIQKKMLLVLLVNRLNLNRKKNIKLILL